MIITDLPVSRMRKRLSPSPGFLTDSETGNLKRGLRDKLYPIIPGINLLSGG
jgi:hypothetical protein